MSPNSDHLWLWEIETTAIEIHQENQMQKQWTIESFVFVWIDEWNGSLYEYNISSMILQSHSLYLVLKQFQ